MNILIVTAHPSSKGFTHRIANIYRKGAEESGKNVEVIDLYAPENRQDFLEFEDVRNWPDDPVRTKMQEKITWADEIVIVHPLWWFDAPAILKNWVDMNFTSGFAYRYTKDSKFLPRQLLKGKIARIFITADGPSWFYSVCKPFKTSWNLGRLGFCGLKLISFRLLSFKRKRTPEYLEKWLEGVYEMSKKKY